MAAYCTKNGHKIGKFRCYDGEVAEYDRTSEKVTVKYSVDENTYTGEFTPYENNRKKAKAGAKVTVMIMPEAPQMPIAVLYGSNSLKRQGIFIAFGAIALILGIINLIAN